MKRRTLIISAIIVVPLAAASLVIGGVSTSWGEAVVRDVVAGAVSDAIPGEVTVETLNDISLLPFGRISADVWNVEFTTAGRPVIQIEHARITHSWSALLAGEVLIDEAEVHGGTVTVEVSPDGGVYLAQAFDGPASGSASSRGHPIPIALRQLRARDMNVLIRLPDQLIQVEGVNSTVNILRQQGPVVVELSELSGTVSKPNIFGSKLSLSQSRGTIGGPGPTMVDLDVRGEFMNADITGSFRYLPESTPPVQVAIEPQGAAARLVANVADFKTMFDGQVSIAVE